MEQWIAHHTRRRTVTFWGDEYEIKPVLAETIIGDGLQLVKFSTIDQRPHYWLIRIDSKTDLFSNEFNEEEIILALEEEFGKHPECLIDETEFYKYKNEGKRFEDYDTFEEYNNACKYPAVWWGGGHYGSIANFGIQTQPH
jgi:hypothetical protein